LSLILLCFVLVFILCFDECIVTITWSLLFVVIALWVICLAQEVTLATRSSSGLPTSVCFPIFYWLMGKHLALLADVVSGFRSFSEAPHLAWKCGHTGVTFLLGLCSPAHRGRGEPAKPGLLYPLVWIPCCDAVSEKPWPQSRVGSVESDLESWVTC
jgi:hypothetical protein